MLSNRPDPRANLDCSVNLNALIIAALRFAISQRMERREKIIMRRFLLSAFHFPRPIRFHSIFATLSTLKTRKCICFDCDDEPSNAFTRRNSKECRARRQREREGRSALPRSGAHADTLTRRAVIFRSFVLSFTFSDEHAFSALISFSLRSLCLLRPNAADDFSVSSQISSSAHRSSPRRRNTQRRVDTQKRNPVRVCD